MHVIILYCEISLSELIPFILLNVQDKHIGKLSILMNNILQTNHKEKKNIMYCKILERTNILLRH